MFSDEVLAAILSIIDWASAHLPNWATIFLRGVEIMMNFGVVVSVIYPPGP
jgi:hypothetical protein